MVRIPQFITAALAITGASAASAVKDLLPDNFDDIVLNSGKPRAHLRGAGRCL
jgi:protein disulfide-isomerase A6